MTACAKADIDRMDAPRASRPSGFTMRQPHGPAYLVQDMLEHLSEEEFQLYLAYYLTVCENADLVGAPGHGLDVLRKPGN